MSIKLSPFHQFLRRPGCWSHPDTIEEGTRSIEYGEVFEAALCGMLTRAPALLPAFDHMDKLASYAKFLGVLPTGSRRSGCSSCTARKGKYFFLRSSRNAINIALGYNRSGAMSELYAQMRECWNVPVDICIVIPYTDLGGNLRKLEE